MTNPVSYPQQIYPSLAAGVDADDAQIPDDQDGEISGDEDEDEEAADDDDEIVGPDGEHG